ncbi:MAG: hypothetical protein R3C11_14760 [Planctomycetaceae bacterium]
MKSEERHHLKENDLQNLLIKSKPFFEKNSSMIIAIGLAIVVAAVVYMWINRPPSASTSGAAKGMLLASSQEDYAAIATDSRYKGTAVAEWALVKEAEMLVGNGITLLFSDRAGAISDLKQAIENFDKVLSSTNDTELKELALYGKACALEASCEGDTSAAIAAFEELVKTVPGSLYVSDSQARIERLKKSNVQSMYKWMAENAGKPQSEQRPLDGMLSNPLDNLGIPGAVNSPSGPQLDLTIPEGTEATPESPESEATPAEPESSETPETSEEPAATEEPAAAEEASTETPAETPGESTPAEPAKTE